MGQMQMIFQDDQESIIIPFYLVRCIFSWHFLWIFRMAKNSLFYDWSK